MFIKKAGPFDPAFPVKNMYKELQLLVTLPYPSRREENGVVVAAARNKVPRS